MDIVSRSTLSPSFCMDITGDTIPEWNVDLMMRSWSTMSGVSSEIGTLESCQLLSCATKNIFLLVLQKQTCINCKCHLTVFSKFKVVFSKEYEISTKNNNEIHFEICFQQNNLCLLDVQIDVNFINCYEVKALFLIKVKKNY